MVSKCLTKYVIRDRAEMASGTETNTETEAQTAKATSAEASQVSVAVWHLLTQGENGFFILKHLFYEYHSF